MAPTHNSIKFPQQKGNYQQTKTSTSSQTKIVIQLSKMVNNVPQFKLKRSKFVAEDNKVQQSKTNPGKIKLKGGPKILKKLGNSCSYNNS